MVKQKPLNDDDKLFTVQKGELVLKCRSKPPKIIDIDQWTDAFICYMSVFITAHPSSTAGLLKYMNTVRLGAKRVGGFGWREYDEQFRLKRARDNNIPWHSIDQELWLLYMHAQDFQSSSVIKTGIQIRKCYDYNYQGSCKRSPCMFKHVCLTCSGNHAMLNCVKRTSASQYSNYNSDFRSGGANARPANNPQFKPQNRFHFKQSGPRNNSN